MGCLITRAAREKVFGCFSHCKVIEEIARGAFWAFFRNAVLSRTWFSRFPGQALFSALFPELEGTHFSRPCLHCFFNNDNVSSLSVFTAFSWGRMLRRRLAWEPSMWVRSGVSPRTGNGWRWRPVLTGPVNVEEGRVLQLTRQAGPLGPDIGGTWPGRRTARYSLHGWLWLSLFPTHLRDRSPMSVPTPSSLAASARDLSPSVRRR